MTTASGLMTGVRPMNKALSIFVLCFVVTCLQGQTDPTPKSEPRSANATPRRDQMALVSPEVHRDRMVTFRLRAPNALEAKVVGDWPGGSSSMTNAKGIWTATIGPIEPGIYGYSF